MSNLGETDWHRLVRYLAGESDPEDEEELQGWILEDTDRARLMDELRQVWNATKGAVPPRDTEAVWGELKEKMHGQNQFDSDERESPSPSARSSSVQNRSSSRRSQRTRWRPFFRVAGILAAIAVASLLTVTLLESSWFASTSETIEEFATEEGEWAVVYLDDGTRVQLNVDSRLSVLEGFSEGRREVRLEGEAYFEVVEKAARPFIVRARDTETEVLGTAFDVKAYGEEENVEVAVAHGQVALRSKRVEMQDPVLLGAQSAGIVSGTRIQKHLEGFDVSRQLAWTDGKLVFDDASFEEVVRKLQRWYDLRIEVQTKPEWVDRLNATFKDESPEEALAAIAAALDLYYQREGKRVVFYGEEGGTSAQVG